VFGAALPILHGSEAELIGGSEIGPGHAGGSADRFHVDVRHHVWRDVLVGGRLLGNLAVRSRGALGQTYDPPSPTSS